MDADFKRFLAWGEKFEYRLADCYKRWRAYEQEREEVRLRELQRREGVSDD